jgi:hypothetical protein
MVHRSGTGQRGVAPRLRRALHVAASSGALALAAPVGATFANEAPFPPVTTPLGTITFDDHSISVTFLVAGPTGPGTPMTVSANPATGEVRMRPGARRAAPPVPRQPKTSTAAAPSPLPVTSPGDIPRGAYDVTITGGSEGADGLAAGTTGAWTTGLGPKGLALGSCRLAGAAAPNAPPSLTCDTGARSAPARGLIPGAIAAAGRSHTPDGVATGSCGAAGSPLFAACISDPLGGGLPLQRCGSRGCGLVGQDGSPALVPLGLALGVVGRPGSAVGSGDAPASSGARTDRGAPGTALAGSGARTDDGTPGTALAGSGARTDHGALGTVLASSGARTDHGAPGTALASTGTPLVAGLAGVVLLMVGGFLTWKRERD